MMAGKPLAALKTELDLGMTIYCGMAPDVWVKQMAGLYGLVHVDPMNGGTPRERPPRDVESYTSTAEQDQEGIPVAVFVDGYTTLAELLEDWPVLAAMPVWSITQTEENKAWRPCSRQEQALRQVVAAGTDQERCLLN